MGAREFTDAEERARRVALVEAVGLRAFGGSWQTPLAEALSAATGRALGRSRVAQWMLSTDPKPVPAWVLDALPAIARDGAARLRVAADELDALFADDGAPPAAQGEPEAEGEAPLESGPADAQAAAPADDEEFDMDAFVEQFAHVRPSQEREPEPQPAPPEGWRSQFAEAHWTNRR